MGATCQTTGSGPLSVNLLQVSCSNVVETSIPQDVVFRLLFVDVLCQTLHNQSEFSLIINGRDDWGRTMLS